MRLSHSAIQALLQCPMKFKLNYLDKAPTKKSVSLLFGSAVHEAIEKGYKHEKDAASFWAEIWAKTLDENPHIQGDKAKYDKVASVIWQTFQRLSPIEYDGKPAVEVWWETPLNFPEQGINRPELSICGKIDLIHKRGGLNATHHHPEVADYKTSQNPPLIKTPKANHFFTFDKDMQFTMYAWAVSKLLQIPDIEQETFSPEQRKHLKKGVKCAHIHLRDYQEFITTRVEDDYQDIFDLIKYFLSVYDAGFFPRSFKDCTYMCDFYGGTCLGACPYASWAKQEQEEELIELPFLTPVETTVKEVSAVSEAATPVSVKPASIPLASVYWKELADVVPTKVSYILPPTETRRIKTEVYWKVKNGEISQDAIEEEVRIRERDWMEANNRLGDWLESRKKLEDEPELPLETPVVSEPITEVVEVKEEVKAENEPELPLGIPVASEPIIEIIEVKEEVKAEEKPKRKRKTTAEKAQEAKKKFEELGAEGCTEKELSLIGERYKIGPYAPKKFGCPQCGEEWTYQENSVNVTCAHCLNEMYPVSYSAGKMGYIIQDQFTTREDYFKTLRPIDLISYGCPSCDFIHNFPIGENSDCPNCKKQTYPTAVINGKQMFRVDNIFVEKDYFDEEEIIEDLDFLFEAA